MELKDIAAVAGKGGLFKIVKPTRTGLILEGFDEKKTKLVTGPNHRVSVLSEISVYTTDPEETLPLDTLLENIKKEFGDDPGLDSKSDKDELMAFMKHIAPNYDPDRVYPSDVKKIVNWYKILLAECPEALIPPAKSEEEPETKEESKTSKKEKTS
ncbi:MAG: DUF5606 domain-containing protein [Cyclobacteriaceae bacterium]